MLLGWRIWSPGWFARMVEYVMFARMVNMFARMVEYVRQDGRICSLGW